MSYCTIPVRSALGEAEAEQLLRDYCQKPEVTCYTDNRIDLQYDLQIVVPAYNAEKWVSSCLKSIFEQQFDDQVLVVVVNDGSTDGTEDCIRKIASRYESKENLTIEIISQKNRGCSSARNAALSEIKAKYVMFVDSDDILPENSIRCMMEKANRLDADILQGNWYNFYDGAPADKIQKVETDHLRGYPWGKLIKHSLLQHFRFPEGYWFEDTPISFLLYGMPARCACIDDIIYGYRLNPSGITATHNQHRKSFDSYWITEQCLQEFERFALPYDQRAYEYLLNQSKRNAWRIRLHPKKIREAQFILTRKLMNEYFSGFHTEKPELKRIEKALQEKRFLYFESLIRLGCF